MTTGSFAVINGCGTLHWESEQGDATQNMKQSTDKSVRKNTTDEAGKSHSQTTVWQSSINIFSNKQNLPSHTASQKHSDGTSSENNCRGHEHKRIMSDISENRNVLTESNSGSKSDVEQPKDDTNSPKPSVRKGTFQNDRDMHVIANRIDNDPESYQFGTPVLNMSHVENKLLLSPGPATTRLSTPTRHRNAFNVHSPMCKSDGVIDSNEAFKEDDEQDIMLIKQFYTQSSSPKELKHSNKSQNNGGKEDKKTGSNLLQSNLFRRRQAIHGSLTINTEQSIDANMSLAFDGPFSPLAPLSPITNSNALCDMNGTSEVRSRFCLVCVSSISGYSIILHTFTLII